MSTIEVFGTFASLVIAASLMMKNLKRLRLINLAGSVMFALYGLGIKALPVFLVNVFIVLIDAWYLYRLRLERSAFSLLHAKKGEGAYLEEFLRFYAKDIAAHAPDFSAEGLEGAEAVFVLRDMMPTSLVIYRRKGEGVFDLLLDYAVPAYRDYKSADFFFRTAAEDIAGKGEARFYAKSAVPVHVKYLKRLGFVESEAGTFIKTVRS
ncbi:MAG: YgjV family protein [Spirochaetaceae bacterium]|nr:YgjV family protein [Spirochaetaceae bacterium]